MNGIKAIQFTPNENAMTWTVGTEGISAIKKFVDVDGTVWFQIFGADQEHPMREINSAIVEAVIYETM